MFFSPYMRSWMVCNAHSPFSRNGQNDHPYCERGALCRPGPEAVDGASAPVYYVLLADDDPVL